MEARWFWCRMARHERGVYTHRLHHSRGTGQASARRLGGPTSETKRAGGSNSRGIADQTGGTQLPFFLLERKNTLSPRSRQKKKRPSLTRTCLPQPGLAALQASKQAPQLLAAGSFRPLSFLHHRPGPSRSSTLAMMHLLTLPPLGLDWFLTQCIFLLLESGA